jgi:hypothetical protein
MCKSQVSKADEVIEKIHKRANELMAIIMEERPTIVFIAVLSVLPVLNLGTECDINDFGLKSLIWLLSLRSNKTTSIVLVLLTTSAASCKLAL